MDINGSVNVHSQSVTVLRNDPKTSNDHYQAAKLQQETQSIDQVTTEQPIKKIQPANEDIVNARLSELRALSSKSPMTADEAIGSLIDITV